MIPSFNQDNFSSYFVRSEYHQLSLQTKTKTDLFLCWGNNEWDRKDLTKIGFTKKSGEVTTTSSVGTLILTNIYHKVMEPGQKVFLPQTKPRSFIGIAIFVK